jgi:hypothetical protein
MSRRSRGVLAAAIVALLLLLALGIAQLPAPGAGPAPGTASASPGGSEAALSLLPTAGATPTLTAGPAPSPSPAPAPTLPALGHVFLIVMENKEAGSIIGSGQAPYINSLAARYGLATNYVAVAHPSEPNYLALWSGSTQGVTDDAVHDFSTGRTLADQLEAHGRAWHVAAQNVPLGCYTGATASGGEDGPGTYARKHEPAVSWRSVSGSRDRCARITDFSHFDPNLGDLWLIVPNLCNDMHDCSIATGDRFLRSFLPTILRSAAFADGVVFLTFDEGTSGAGGGGKVATLVISPLAKPRFTSAVRHTHYSLLRTIEAAWGLPCLANACAANDLREFFR